jgi:hypothetical protein
VGVSAYQSALEKGERHRAGQAIDPTGTYYWDDTAGGWRPLDVYVAAQAVPARPPDWAPAGKRAGPAASSPLVPLAVVVAVGAGAWWLWRRK